MKRLAMVAFGGNALLRAGEKGTYEQQLANVESTCEQLRPLVEKGYNIVIGHGNGPQVGNVLLQHEAGKQVFGLEAMPMDFCGAETQGSIAYMIESAMGRVLKRAGVDRKVVSLVTRVEVSADDPGFANPTKPVGPYYADIPGCAGNDAPAGPSAPGNAGIGFPLRDTARPFARRGWPCGHICGQPRADSGVGAEKILQAGGEAESAETAHTRGIPGTEDRRGGHTFPVQFARTGRFCNYIRRRTEHTEYNTTAKQ